jgi:hypothetical protein
MSDVQLVWSNKHLPLLASGVSSYEWVQPTDSRRVAVSKIEPLSSGPLSTNSNVLAIGDGLDVLEALKANTSVMDSGIRLVYIDPPFNTQVNFRQYSDSMQRPMWLSMMRDRLEALRPMLAEDASVWVHLDDSEVHRARAVMDEVFGEDAFVASVIWQKKTTRDSRAAFSSNHDTILVYAPSGPKSGKLHEIFSQRKIHIYATAMTTHADRGPTHRLRLPDIAKLSNTKLLPQLGNYSRHHVEDLGMQQSKLSWTCLLMEESGSRKVVMGRRV